LIGIRQRWQSEQRRYILADLTDPVTTIPDTIVETSIEFLPLDRNKWQTGISLDGWDTITTAVSCGKLYVFGELFSEIT